MWIYDLHYVGSTICPVIYILIFGSFYHDFPNEEQVMIINSFSLNILIIPVLNID